MRQTISFSVSGQTLDEIIEDALLVYREFSGDPTATFGYGDSVDIRPDLDPYEFDSDRPPLWKADITILRKDSDA